MKFKFFYFFLIATLFTLTLSAHSITFTDDFNDGDMEGWTMKSGYWSNPGDNLLSSYYNYGILWKDDSFGMDQQASVDAYFVDGRISKSAVIRLRSGNSGYGPNPYFDHGYVALVMTNYVAIQNCVRPYFQLHLANMNVDLPTNTWHNVEFSVEGTGTNTRLILKVNGEVYLDVYDTSAYSHDDGGVIALGASNHINRQIVYDNFVGEITGPDSDGDGIEDADDLCVDEDATGLDANKDGCIDTTENMSEIIFEMDIPEQIASTLDKSLDGIQTAIDELPEEVLENRINALINKINAQSDKKISIEDAQFLIEFAENILKSASE
ncbi:MAG: hypothetical protein KAQ98_06795 [Bacteriovoracaceae bacterium]|nr:hypothetical protein [Bacteriovoracaceae bacterium]